MRWSVWGCGVYMRMGVCVGGGCHLQVIELGKYNFYEGIWGWGVDVGGMVVMGEGAGNAAENKTHVYFRLGKYS